jgi:hypothetical protein
MNKILLLFVLSFALFSFTVLQAGKDDMINALKSGNAEEFVKYFDNSIDIKLPNSNEMKSVPKAQAASTIKSFFANNNVSSCTITSQRENAGTMYITGKLSGSGNYNITVMIKSAGDKFSVITLRINV